MKRLASTLSASTKEHVSFHETSSLSPYFEMTYTEREDIFPILSALFNNNSMAYGHDANHNLFLARAECISGSLSEDQYLYWKVNRHPGSSRISIYVFGFNSVYSMFFSTSIFSSSIVETPLPSSLSVCRRREERRVPSPTETHICFSHPYWPSIEIDYSVYDISFHGISFVLDKDIDILRGWRLLSLSVVHKERTVFSGVATVQHVSKTIPGRLIAEPHDVTICGLKLIFSNHQESTWRAFVDGILHARTSTTVDLDKAWTLYSASGYFNLSGKSPHDFVDTKQDFFSSSNLLSCEPSLGCHATLQEEEEPIAIVTYAHVYSNTWQLMNLAKQYRKVLPSKKENRLYNRNILKEIYLQAIELYLSYPELKWFLTYAKKGNAWTQQVHHDFALKYLFSGEVYMSDIDLIEVNTNCDAAACNSEFSISPPNQADADMLFSFLTVNYPKSYWKGLDLTAGRPIPDAVPLSEGFCLHREMRVAKYQGIPVAFSVMESASPAPSLFGLFDNLKLFSMKGRFGEDAFVPLIYNAAVWFREYSKSKFIYYNNSQYDAKKLPSIACHLGEGIMHIVSRHLLPSFLEHVFVTSLSS